jgi:hypothetical protein
MTEDGQEDARTVAPLADHPIAPAGWFLGSRLVQMLTSSRSPLPLVWNWLTGGLSERVRGVLPLRHVPDMNFFDEDDHFGDFFGDHRGGSKFLGRFSVGEMTSLVTRSPFGDRLRMRGIDDWFIEFDLRDCFVHYCYMRRQCLPEPDKYIGFLIVQLGDFVTRQTVMRTRLPERLNILNVRWIALQDPLGEFSERRPRLPGQRFPGTGMGHEVYETLIVEATRSGRDGIVNIPEHFHNAFLYKGFQFLNPDREGWFRKLQRDLAADIDEKGLAAVSWALYLGFLRCDGQPVRWEPQEQLFPLSERLKTYFTSREFRGAVHQAFQQVGQFSIRWEEAERYCLSAILEADITPEPPH